MRVLKTIGITAAAVLVAIQFFRTDRNENPEKLPSDLENTILVPLDVSTIFKKACYDCHSNTTKYPWYTNIQPVGWFLENHIKDGKANLNFSEFGLYSARKQQSKLRAIESSMVDRTMPINSYKLLHRAAKLTDGERKSIIDWVNHSLDRLHNHNN